ncbi:MAG: acetamidase/formamidase family protein [Clostridiales bacterium]|nr:acetamidase/formamidase family protein [Clostridiales bacterium]
MIRELDISNTVFEYDESQKPAMYADPGDTIIFNSYDFVLNKLSSEKILKSQIIKDGFVRQSVCGNVYINGSEPGDTLKVTVNQIEITADAGTVAVYPPDFEVLGAYIDQEETLKIPIKDGQALFFDGRIKIPICPMIGALAVCAAGVVEDTVTPGRYGGNMDCKMLQEGASIYLPVTVPGALLSMGDVHGLQGDGEIFSALEVPSRITVTVELIKAKQEKWPVLETSDAWYWIASADTMDEANVEAMKAGAEFLLKRGGGLTSTEWIVMLGIVGELEVCNFVDPRVSARLKMPKYVASEISF